MNEFLTEDTMAIILLCGVMGQDHSEKPLSPAEYSSLVRWLMGVKMRPGDLLQQEHIAAASVGTGINRQRLESLLGRGVQLGFAVEEWQRNGIWVISRSDPDYPSRYKKHLGDKAPPLLYGVGDRKLLAGGGLAIVGSRNVDKDGENFARRTAELCAFNGMPVVSGGARGVDRLAMTAALDADGVSIGVLVENLLKNSVERSARHAIAAGKLLLLSPYHPNARFTVGAAMSRNKLIYAMADYGLVVSAEHGKGGTWAGAEEELKRDKSLPVFVRVGNNTPLGNKKLLDLGAIAWPELTDINNLSQQLFALSAKISEKNSQAELSLFDFSKTPDAATTEPLPEASDTVRDAPSSPKPASTPEEPPDSIYRAVLPVILNKLERPVTIEQLAESLDVVKTQLNLWMKKAVDENKVVKLSGPARYKKS
ncbi:MAG: DNA-processing protein DprA [Pseudomonadota bacterium]